MTDPITYYDPPTTYIEVPSVDALQVKDNIYRALTRAMLLNKFSPEFIETLRNNELLYPTTADYVNSVCIRFINITKFLCKNYSILGMEEKLRKANWELRRELTFHTFCVESDKYISNYCKDHLDEPLEEYLRIVREYIDRCLVKDLACNDELTRLLADVDDQEKSS